MKVTPEHLAKHVNDEPYHAEDCHAAGCDGCGWIDGDGLWQPGPCPTDQVRYQQARSENIA